MVNIPPSRHTQLRLDPVPIGHGGREGDARVARFLQVPIFPLCGYRRLASAEGKMILARRVEALRNGR